MKLSFHFCDVILRKEHFGMMAKLVTVKNEWLENKVYNEIGLCAHIVNNIWKEISEDCVIT